VFQVEEKFKPVAQQESAKIHPCRKDRPGRRGAGDDNEVGKEPAGYASG